MGMTTNKRANQCHGQKNEQCLDSVHVKNKDRRRKMPVAYKTRNLKQESKKTAKEAKDQEWMEIGTQMLLAVPCICKASKSFEVSLLTRSCQICRAPETLWPGTDRMHLYIGS